MRLLVGVLVVASGCGFVALWWWRARESPDRGKYVSSTWLDDHIRGRRE
jgi:hypothetical protein